MNILSEVKRKNIFVVYISLNELKVLNIGQIGKFCATLPGLSSKNDSNAMRKSGKIEIVFHKAFVNVFCNASRIKSKSPFLRMYTHVQCKGTRILETVMEAMHLMTNFVI